MKWRICVSALHKQQPLLTFLCLINIAGQVSSQPANRVRHSQSSLRSTGEDVEGQMEAMTCSGVCLFCRITANCVQVFWLPLVRQEAGGRSASCSCREACGGFKKISSSEKKHWLLPLRLWLPGWWPGLLCVWYNYWGRFISLLRCNK